MTRQRHNALGILDQLLFSNPTVPIIYKPFYAQDNTFVQPSSLDYEGEQIFKRLDSIYNLPFYLRMMYKSCANKKTEILLKNITFFSLEIINEFATKNASIGLTNWIDIACVYCGLGNVLLIAYEKNSKKYFIRCDGGENEYTRYANFEKYMLNKYQPSNVYLKSLEEVVELTKNINDDSTEIIKVMILNNDIVCL